MKMIVVLLALAVLTAFAIDAFAFAKGSQPSDAPTVTVTYFRR